MLHIQSERLIMIPFSPQLIKLALHDRAQLQSMLNTDIPDNWPNTDFAEFLPMMLAGFEKDLTREVWNGLIILKEQRVLVGDMGFKDGPDAEGTAEIGYSIVPEYQNHGYATEMAEALITWAFEQKGIKKVIAECLNDNIGSIRVLEKLGMRQTGSDENMLQWTLSQEPLDRLRTICLALPEASEQGGVGDPSFKVRDKIFAMQHRVNDRHPVRSYIS